VDSSIRREEKRSSVTGMCPVNPVLKGDLEAAHDKGITTEKEYEDTKKKSTEQRKGDTGNRGQVFF
jgi:hypothetical protein